MLGSSSSTTVTSSGRCGRPSRGTSASAPTARTNSIWVSYSIAQYSIRGSVLSGSKSAVSQRWHTPLRGAETNTSPRRSWRLTRPPAARWWSRCMTMSARSTVMSSDLSVEGSWGGASRQSKMSEASIRPAVTMSMSSSGSSSMLVIVSSGAVSLSSGRDGTSTPRMPVENPPTVIRPRGSPDRALASVSRLSRSWSSSAPRRLSSRPIGVSAIPRPVRSVTGAPR